MPRASDLLTRGSREHYDDVELYDYEYRRRRRDVHFYRSFADTHQPGGATILELACGSGRLTRELSRGGHRVCAFDASRSMLARADKRLRHTGRAARARVFLFAADLREFALRQRFSLAIAAFNSMEHLYTRLDMQMCLARVREHLQPQGVFVFDVQMPDLAWLVRDPDKRWAKTRFRHPRTGQRLEYSTNHDYDPVRQIAYIRIYYRPVEPGPLRREKVVHLTQRKYYPAELEALVAHAGFRVEKHLGDFRGEPLDAGVESQVLVCRRATS